MSFCYHSSTNRYPTVTALNARIRLHVYKQQDSQSVQDFIKEIRSLAEAVKEVDGGQGVGTDGGCFEHVETIFKKLHGNIPSIEDDPDLCEVCQDVLERFNEELMITMITLKGVLPLKHDLLKMGLQSNYNL